MPREGLLAFRCHPGGVATELAVGMPKFMHPILGDTAQLAGDSNVWLTRERRGWLEDRFVSLQVGYGGVGSEAEQH
jgi:hypothetical protein